jgi:hypothetical protein
MKKTKLFIITIICLMATMMSVSAAEIIFDASIEKPSQELFIYHMNTPQFTPGQIVEKCALVLRGLGLKPIPEQYFKSIKDRMAYMDDVIQFSMNNTGSEFYFTNFPELKLTEKSEGLVSDAMARELSYQFLKTSGLLPKNIEELKIDHVGGIMQMLSSGRVPEKKAVVVYFKRIIDKLAVKNYGSAMNLTFTNLKTPIGVQYHWREIMEKEPVDYKFILDPDRVYSAIREDASGVYSEKSVIIVNKIDLVLYDNGGKYIQPAYCYQGIRKAIKDEFKEMPILGYVPALGYTLEPIRHPALSTDLPMPNSRELVQKETNE